MSFVGLYLKYPTMDVIVEPDISLIILRRLEAATSRLEDMVPHMAEQSSITNGLSSPDPAQSNAVGAKQAEGAVTSPTPSAAPLPASIDDFDKVINGEVTTFVAMSEEIGGLLAEQVSNHKLKHKSHQKRGAGPRLTYGWFE